MTFLVGGGEGWGGEGEKEEEGEGDVHGWFFVCGWVMGADGNGRVDVLG